MNLSDLIYNSPLWLVFIVTIIFLIVTFEAGFLIGRYRKRRSEREKDSPIGAIVASTLALLAFMLTFTFGTAFSHLDARKQAFSDEIEAIRGTYLRSDLLPEPYRLESRKLLKEYVDIRTQNLTTEQEVIKALDRSEEIHRILWSKLPDFSKKPSDSTYVSLYIQALNDMINLHFRRIDTVIHNQIPLAIWATLYSITCWAIMLLGYQGGVSEKRGFLAFLILGIAFSTVLILIADIDRSQHGLFEVDQQPMSDLKEMLSKI